MPLSNGICFAKLSDDIIKQENPHGKKSNNKEKEKYFTWSARKPISGNREGYITPEN